ncbi:MAG: hypothetical protein DRH04_07175 [Deltaproteobacteria bacterium]|nr:MAG: hypothetical protein DRH04_07175 [Deltaproteobacteria bacterium]
MKYPNIYFVSFIFFTGLFFTYSLPAVAMTPKHQSHHTQQERLSTRRGPLQKKAVYLLDWQGNKLTTTAGVFLLNDEIEIIDKNNIRETLSLQQQKRRHLRRRHRVIIEKSGRNIVRITIK